MKHALAASLLATASLAIPLADAQSQGMGGMDMKMDKKSAEATAHKATGVVTKVDKDKVTIRHEPVQSLNWPSMNMKFTVKDKAVLDKLAKDRKVDFEFNQEGKDYVITAVK